MSKSAQEHELQALHAQVAKTLKDEIATDYFEESGEKKPKSASLLAVAVKFLKDNGIEPARGANNKALDELSRKVDEVTKGGDPDELRDLLN
jgi:hypothetical protein